MKNLRTWIMTLILCAISLGAGLFIPDWLEQQNQPATTQATIMQVEITPAVSATSTPLVVAQAQNDVPTPTNTLRPPPTIEPPTSTPLPSATPTLTPTLSVVINVTVEGIQGLPTATALPEEACVPRKDWTLEYTIQDNETLSSIADKFDTYANFIAEGNCIEDANFIRSGQVIRVPGDAIPVEPAIVCEPYTLLQPINNAWGIPAAGQLVFNWRGTRAPRNLLRLYPPDYDFSNPDHEKWIDITFDLRQNETINLADYPEGGLWHWQVYPLDEGFVQFCPESPLWSFNKDARN